ncbi:MAG: DNA polymerase Y family protein, partial [Pseudomonadota bacterium]
FSSLVSLQPPQALVLEVRSSLRLFGGIESLCAQLLGSLQADGYHLRHSVAPSARGAYWLARGGFSPQPEQVVQSGRAAASFLSALNALDIGVTGWDDNIISALREMGVDTLADCRRLPRAGLTRRFGTELLHSLGQAYAELPEAREAINEQQRFQAVLSLEAEISEAPRLRDACEQLLTQLEQFLRARQRAVRVLKFDFHGWHDKAGELQVSLSMAGHQRAHWQRVLSAQLERCRLSSPAVAVGLCAEASDALRAQSARLEFAEDAGSSTAASEQALHDFLDRLHARIGSQSVRALQHVAEHRPEYASRAVKAAGGVHKTGLPKDWLLHDVPAEAIDLAHNANLTLQRPLWLAMPILSLHVDAYGVVYYGGALTLQHGPERIESAWWQDESLARDYFIAENTAGVRVWVFRETHQDGGQHWWLQGVFG